MARKSSVWPLAISLAATLAIEFSFSSCRYLDVSVHDVPSITLWIHVIVTECFSAGFPHSDICGSSDICSLPQLFAAYHVLLRLLVPRHPPYALLRLIIPVRLRRTGQECFAFLRFFALRTVSFLKWSSYLFRRFVFRLSFSIKLIRVQNIFLIWILFWSVLIFCLWFLGSPL